MLIAELQADTTYNTRQLVVDENIIKRLHNYTLKKGGQERSAEGYVGLISEKNRAVGWKR